MSKVALVTGGGTGIGAAVAGRFVADGGHAVVVGRRAAPLEEVAARTGALAVPGDAGVAADMEKAVATAVREYGRLDVLVANAGAHAGDGTALDVDDESWQGLLHANVTTAFVSVRAALPSLVERGGSVVVVSSLAGVFAGPDVVGYTTTKHALIGLTRSLARDYGPRGVRVNVVCPGWVRTAMADEQMDALGARHGLTRDGAYAEATAEVPLRRPGTPDEIAGICRFLASDEASIVTGSVIMADGGASVVDLPTLAFTRDTTVGRRATDQEVR